MPKPATRNPKKLAAATAPGDSEAAACELIGYENIVSYLNSCLDMDRLACTYLFSGPSGIGKRVIARHLARLALCRRREHGSACGLCPSCVAFAKGTNIYFSERNLTEISRAKQKEKDEHRAEEESGPRSPGTKSSMSKVDMLREFIAEVKCVASPERPVFYLLPNIQEYSPQAQNSLLKSLEEPPPGATFILTSDEPERMLKTILSRCQHIPVPLLPETRVAQILEKKGISAVEAATFAALSGGRVEYALKFSQEPYQKLFEWMDRVLSEGREDFLTVADEAAELGDRLEKDKDKREKLAELATLFQNRMIGGLPTRVKTHFLAMQILSTAQEELLKSRHSLATSGLVSLCLEHFFYIALSRRTQILKYASMKEVG